MKQEYITFLNQNPPIKAQLIKKLNSTFLLFIDDRWNTLNLSSVCRMIQQWKCQKFWLYKNRNPIILKELTHINFPELKQIDVSFNDISSIEGISRMHIPKLSQFIISDNLVLSLKDFRKGYWPSLKILELGKNYINDEEEITKLWMKEAETIKLKNGDQNWIVKLETKNIAKIVKYKVINFSLKSLTNRFSVASVSF